MRRTAAWFSIGFAFECPPECVTCAAEEYLGTTSKTYFSCLLRDKKLVPKQRFCKDAEAVSGTSPHYRSKCKFTPDEAEEEAWDELGEQSATTTCCCAKSEAWTETKCLDLTTTDAVWLGRSSRGTTETFFRSDVQTSSNRSNCLRWKETDCVEHCDRYQQLYKCSSDGGLSPSGWLYYRVSLDAGWCVGDATSAGDVEKWNPGKPIKGTGLDTSPRLNGAKCPAGLFGLDTPWKEHEGALHHPCRCSWAGFPNKCNTGGIPGVLV
mmetsp:Transcript_82698/g.189025  ORF Transcript_82698/g.189025 Transcript_82698/m.189025 type:complete len:266 (+) Transcript_82698:23-820(+)